ncbi:hypothetical protein AAFC00_006410 [Neodothiora populina]|uniref:Cytidyltransferase-like domain-containing protein n=1 Tax=Neodothiora populina TaxID=2781224 RepID=A0ABR3P5V5_9PEZI
MADGAPATFLLLLPPPSTVSVSALKAAYGETLSEVLKEVASATQETVRPAVLDIALAIPHLVGKDTEPRASLYDRTQTIIAAVYKLVCVLATADNINIEDSDGVDARIIPIAWSPDATSTANSPFGPVVDLVTLAGSGRQWQYAFGVETDAGEAFVRAFVAAKQHASHGHHKHSNVEKSTEGSASKYAESSSAHKKHHHTAVGGTFDHLHLGHKLLLTMTAFALDDSNGIITLGITGDELLKNKKHAEYLESWSQRQSSTYQFLSDIMDFNVPDSRSPVVEEVKNDGPNGHVVTVRYGNALEFRFVEIVDPFGPTITDESITNLVLSGETRSGGKAINEKRAEKGWSELQVFEVDVLDPTSDATATEISDQSSYKDKLSSSAIRTRLAEKKASPTA